MQFFLYTTKQLYNYFLYLLLFNIKENNVYIAKLCDFGGSSFSFARNQTRNAHG